MNQKNKELIQEYNQYLNTKKIGKRYKHDLIKQATDLANHVKKDLDSITLNDIQSFYELVIGQKGITHKTIECYANRLKHLYVYMFYENRKYKEYSTIEKAIKSIFKQRLVDERQKLDITQHIRNKKQKTVQKYLNDGIKVGNRIQKLSGEQQETLREYYDRIIINNIGQHSLNNTFCCLFQYGIFLNKPYNKAEKKDLIGYFSKLSKENKSIPTINSRKACIKRFYKWLIDDTLDNEAPYPDLVKEFKLNKIPIRKQKNEMLSQTEIQMMCDSSTHPQHKCIIKLIYGLGLRCSESLLKRKDVVFDDKGFFKIYVTRKSRGLRQEEKKRQGLIVPKIAYAELYDWYFKYHPFKDNPESSLFVSLRAYGTPLMQNGISQILKKSARAAGINKRVHPHLLRHSRITHTGHWGDNRQKIYFWGNNQSAMISVYNHEDEEEVNNQILKDDGLLDDEQKTDAEKILKPSYCPRCEKHNPSGSLYCNCGMPLTDEELVKHQELSKKADTFTTSLMKEPLNDVDTSKGMMEAMFQNMIKNPEMLDKFKEMLEE